MINFNQARLRSCFPYIHLEVLRGQRGGEKMRLGTSQVCLVPTSELVDPRNFLGLLGTDIGTSVDPRNFRVRVVPISELLKTLGTSWVRLVPISELFKFFRTSWIRKRSENSNLALLYSLWDVQKLSYTSTFRTQTLFPKGTWESIEGPFRNRTSNHLSK